MTEAYREGFVSRCRELGLDDRASDSLLKRAEAKDPNLQRATEIFQDWLTVPKHVVQRGEVLSGIARKNNVGLQELMDFNNLANSLSIRPGQVVRIPPAKRDSGSGSKDCAGGTSEARG